MAVTPPTLTSRPDPWSTVGTTSLRNGSMSSSVSTAWGAVSGTTNTTAASARWFDSGGAANATPGRSEEHTSELQSLMRISYAVFCLKKKNIIDIQTHTYSTNEIIYNNHTN